jgi:hypothetical protein
MEECWHCKKFTPIWNVIKAFFETSDVQTILKSKNKEVLLRMVGSDSEETRQKGIRGFPTVFLSINDGPDVELYGKPIKLKELIKKMFTENELVNLLSVEVDKFKTSYKYPTELPDDVSSVDVNPTLDILLGKTMSGGFLHKYQKYKLKYNENKYKLNKYKSKYISLKNIINNNNIL